MALNSISLVGFFSIFLFLFLLLLGFFYEWKVGALEWD
jgi:NADH-quinone oxidoreductase subunit A